MSKKAVKISVIIPTYNSVKTLIPCIVSVLHQTLKPFEIIVIDNASTDNTREGLAGLINKNKLIKYFRNDENLGVTGGRNKGIKEVSQKANHLFFFDHDMVGDKDMLRELVKVALKKKEIGIVTPKIYYNKEKKRIWAAGTGMNLWTGQVLFRGGEDKGQYNKAEEVQVAPAALLVKAGVIKRIGGFDDKYFATYEDTEFCFRAKRQGFLTYYSPKAIAWHKISPNPEDEKERLLSRSYWVGRNRILFMKEHGKSIIFFAIFYPIFIGYYLLMAFTSGKLKSGVDFIKGSIDGFLGR